MMTIVLMVNLDFGQDDIDRLLLQVEEDDLVAAKSCVSIAIERWRIGRLNKTVEELTEEELIAQNIKYKNLNYDVLDIDMF